MDRVYEFSKKIPSNYLIDTLKLKTFVSSDSSMSIITASEEGTARISQLQASMRETDTTDRLKIMETRKTLVKMS